MICSGRWPSACFSLQFATLELFLSSSAIVFVSESKLTHTTILFTYSSIQTVEGVNASPYEDNLRYFNVVIQGPRESPYEGTFCERLSSRVL